MERMDMWWSRKKDSKYRVHYLNTVIECKCGNDKMFMSVSDIEYIDEEGKKFDVYVLTNGNDTYFDSNGITGLFGLNFICLCDYPKVITDRVGWNYIHYDSIKEIIDNYNGSERYKLQLRLINRISFDNRIDRNNTFECLTRKLKTISNIGGYSSWKKLK